MHGLFSLFFANKGHYLLNKTVTDYSKNIFLLHYIMVRENFDDSLILGISVKTNVF